MKQSSLALFTDLYELTMAYGYWKQKIASKEAVFHLFFRKFPFSGGYAIAAGLETVIEILHNFHFDDSDISYLRSIFPNFDDAFFQFLGTLRFSCDVDAVKEGTVVFPSQPLIRVKGPLLQAQLLESVLLNILNFQTLVATKASRVVQAAQNDPVVEFGMRRAQGFDGAMSASRAAFIGGCQSTSNVLAGKMFGIPVRGTMAHSWVMAFPSEIESFVAYGEVYPQNVFLLIDTYDTVRGAQRATMAAAKLKKSLQGVRLDSGDLYFLSRQVRKILDDASFPHAKIMASNELDEKIIQDLKFKRAPIDLWGVGTNLVTGRPESAIDGVYKISAIKEGNHWRDLIKISEDRMKASPPGILQIRRFSKNSENAMDMIYDENFPPKENIIINLLSDQTKSAEGCSSEDLLVPIFRSGKCVYEKPSLMAIQKNTFENLSCFPKTIRDFENPYRYFYGLEKGLDERKKELIREMEKS